MKAPQSKVLSGRVDPKVMLACCRTLDAKGMDIKSHWSVIRVVLEAFAKAHQPDLMAAPWHPSLDQELADYAQVRNPLNSSRLIDDIVKSVQDKLGSQVTVGESE